MRVEFRVPVWVHVDVANGDVVSVHVDDVSVEGPIGVYAYSGACARPELRQAAIELTSDNTAWPHWTVGFDHA